MRDTELNVWLKKKKKKNKRRDMAITRTRVLIFTYQSRFIVPGTRDIPFQRTRSYESRMFPSYLSIVKLDYH